MTGRFLKGPIPMNELWVAARLPGQALAVYLAIRHQCDLTGKACVTLPGALLERFGVDKDAKSRALRSLSAAGLIRVDQQRGRSARVSPCGVR
ncbi:DNA-binding MarR family transcriptional regulator [Bradyrhizobium sp. S3.3.6]